MLGAVGVGLGAGAVVEYLFDPDRGRARRVRIRDRSVHAVHEARGWLDVLSRDVANRARGRVASARY